MVTGKETRLPSRNTATTIAGPQGPCAWAARKSRTRSAIAASASPVKRQARASASSTRATKAILRVVRLGMPEQKHVLVRLAIVRYQSET